MSRQLLVAGGTVVTEAARREADVLIEGGIVAAVGVDLPTAEAQVVDATGRLVLPGGVDAHTHFGATFGGATSVDDFLTGSRGALFGGTTTVIDFVEQARGHSPLRAFTERRDSIEGRSHVDFGLHLIACDPGVAIPELAELRDAGVASIQVTLSDPGGWMLGDDEALELMFAAAELGLLVVLDAENGNAASVLEARSLAAGRHSPSDHARAHPTALEAEAVHRALVLAAIAECDLHVSLVSSELTLEVLAAARTAGQRVTADTCPQYLWLTDELLARADGSKFVCVPPLRSSTDALAVRTALSAGDLDLVVSDHCAFSFEGQKAAARDFTEIPGGLNTAEHRYSLLLDAALGGAISLERAVEVAAAEPARRFGAHPRKGTIAPGADADVVVFEPSGTRTLTAASTHTAGDHTCFEATRVRGAVETVIRGGRIAVAGGHLADGATGRYLQR